MGAIGYRRLSSSIVARVLTLNNFRKAFDQIFPKTFRFSVVNVHAVGGSSAERRSPPLCSTSDHYGAVAAIPPETHLCEKLATFPVGSKKYLAPPEAVVWQTKNGVERAAPSTSKQRARQAFQG